MREVSRRSVVKSCILSGFVAVSPGGTAFAQSTAPRFPRISVKIGNTAAATTWSIQSLLASEGILDEFGLDATHVNVSDGGKLIGSLLSGEIDVCMLTGIAQLLPAIEKGAKIKLIAGANVRPTFAVYAKPPEIKTLADLVGRTVGTGAPGSLLHHVMVAAFVKAGVDYTKVNFVNVGSSADVFKALTAGTIDACPSSFEYFNQQARFGVHAISELWDYLPQYPFQGSFASDDAIANKRDTLTRVLAAYAKLYRFLMTPESKAPYAAAYQAVTGGKPPDGEDQSDFYRRNKGLATDLVIPEASVQFLQDLNVRLGIQSKTIPFDAVCDMSLAQNAIAMLS